MRAGLKVKVPDALLEGALGLLEDVGVNDSKVGFALLELARADGEKVVGGEFGGDVRDEEGGEGDIEWENGPNAVSAVCPKRVRNDSGPPRDVAFACLDDRLSDCAVLVFGDPVCTRVVSQDT